MTYKESVNLYVLILLDIFMRLPWSFGFLRTFRLLYGSTLPLPFVLSGAILMPPLSLMIRPMVAGLGHVRFCLTQNDSNNGCSFFSPRFGYRSRSRSSSP